MIGMLLIDYSQISIANYLALTKGEPIIDVSLIRHCILSAIKDQIIQFPEQASRGIVIAVDSESWRKEVFPLYKAKRAASRSKSDVDWKALFEFTKLVWQELHEFCPFFVIKTPRAEADDIIATLTRYSTSRGNSVAIVSSDKDHKQLQGPLVRIWSPLSKEEIPWDGLSTFNALQEHIICGDVSDGIPNIHSDDDCFVVQGKRQSPMRKSMVAAYVTGGKSVMDERTRRNYDRNKALIDYNEIPKSVQDSIIHTFESYDMSRKNQNTMLQYFVDKGLRRLIGCVNTFSPRKKESIPEIYQ